MLARSKSRVLQLACKGLVSLFLCRFCLGQNAGTGSELTLTARESRSIATTTGNYTELACDVGGSAEGAIVAWSVNGTAINSTTSENYEVQPSRGVLVLKKTVPELQGTYTCQLSTDPSVYDTVELAIHEGCFPDVFRSFALVGQTVSVSCNQFDSTFNSNGNITFRCVSHRRWETDLSRCLLDPAKAADVQLLPFTYRLPVAFPASTVTAIVTVINYQEKIRNFFTAQLIPNGINITAFRVSFFGPTEQASHSIMMIIVEIVKTTRFSGLQTVAGQSILLSESDSNATISAMPVSPGLLVFTVADSCVCPHLISLYDGRLALGEVFPVGFCAAPMYVRGPCDKDGEAYKCSALFTDDLQRPQHCQLDTDQDGIPNSVDTCEFCCAGNFDSGFSWTDTLVGVRATRKCSRLHSSFNKRSLAVRRCDNHRWTSVDTSACTFAPGSRATIVVVMGQVDLLAISQREGSSVDDSVRRELSMAFDLFNPLKMDVRVSLTSNDSLVTAVVEFPLDVSGEVINALDRINFVYFTKKPAIYGHRPVASCPCVPYTSGTSGLMVETCTGAPQPPCTCTPTDRGYNCQCSDPYARVVSKETALKCSVDGDGDGVPDSQDNCPERHDPSNLCQNTAPGIALTDMGYAVCKGVTDARWGIAWDAVPVGTIDHKRCPGGIAESSGIARRLCSRDNGKWAVPDLSACDSLEYIETRSTINSALISLKSSEVFAQSSLVSEALEVSPALQSVIQESVDFFRDNSEVTVIPLFPRDLQTINEAVEMLSSFAEETNLFALPDFNEDDLFTIVDHVLNPDTADEWSQLNEVNRDGAAVLMRSVERMAMVFATSLATNPNVTMEMDNGVLNMFASLQTPRIAVSAQSIGTGSALPRVDRPGGTQSGSAAGPSAFTQKDRAPQIAIPAQLLQERGAGASHVSIVSVAFDSLPNLLPRTEFFSSQMSNVKADNLRVGTLILSTQVSSFDGYSESLREAPVELMFPIDAMYKAADTYCVFWNYSEGTSATPGLGGWARDGIADGAKEADSASCSSTHLTTFAILVDTTGLTTTIDETELFALELVTYIGCGVSLACLLLTVLFFLSLGKELIQKVINYVHFNLCIALICGLVIFLAGIETAAWSVASCTIVAVLLHYFFLAAFSWMLCEGIVLYNLLVKVFRVNEKKWIYIYTVLGWGIPVPIVAISVGARWEYYRIPQSYNTSSSLYNVTRACWLSHEYGTIAGFIAPMLAIVLINLVFVIMALRGLYRFKKNQAKRTLMSDSNATKGLGPGVALLKSIVILTPLLGFTWVVGLLAVNNYTTVFAWLFCFLNAFQGVFIFYFHVVRNDKVWPKLVGIIFGVKSKDSTESSSRFSFLSRQITRTSKFSKRTSSSIISKSSRLYRGTSSSSIVASNDPDVLVKQRPVGTGEQKDQKESVILFVNSMPEIAEENIELEYAGGDSQPSNGLP